MVREIEPETRSPVNIVLVIITIFSLIFLILILGYLFYFNMPGIAQNLNIEIDKNFSSNISEEVVMNQTSEVKQFYPNMKFNHNKISYSFDDYCIDEEKNRMIKAFKEFSSKVPVSFFEKQAGDIEISCNEENRPDIGEKYFVAGEGGAKKIIQTGRYNVINDGIIFIYEENKKSFECDYPGVELHELMHVFGFDHSSDKNSLMYPYLESCDQRLDQSIIDTLKKLYSTENLADLYFEDVNAVKKGRYLDFNLTVRNSGDIDANNANFSILDDGSLVESKSLGDVKYGAGIFIEIKNFKLIHRNPKEISFVIDYEKKIKEIDESNNVADVKFE